MKDLGPLHYFLGISVKHDITSMFLSQDKYASEIIARAKIRDYNPIQTPVDTAGKISNEAGDLIDDPTAYRSLDGAF